jgi:two-component system, sensor histidine kinase PdtaS
LAPALRIVVPYLLLGSAWILFSDRLLLGLAGDPSSLLVMSIVKGWFYVLVTGSLLLALIVRELKTMNDLEARLRVGLAEKEALLFELNHRVKNNLQLILSILNLEGEDLGGEEARGLNDRTRARVRAMALAHERLFEGETIARVDLGAYLRALWEAAADIYAASGAKAEFLLSPIAANAEETVPFGLFATEAITNAIRYGADADGRLSVSISLGRPSGGDIELTIRDRGKGTPQGSNGLGIKLMDALAGQLRGNVMRYNDGGSVVRLRFASEGLADA